MGILDIFRRRRAEPAPQIEARATEPVDSELRHALIGPFRSDAHVLVTEENIEGNSTAMACATLCARAIAMLPAHVMAPRSADAADGNERLADHPVAALLSTSPNADMTGFRFREALLMAAQFHGNAYAEIERDTAGRPVALWPIHPARVEPDRTDDGEKVFKVHNGHAAPPAVLAEADMFHLCGPSLDGQTGLSVIAYARQSLGLSIAQERFAASWLANAGAPSGLIKLGRNMSDTAVNRARAEIEARYKGPRQAGKMVIGDADWDWKQIGMSMMDSEFMSQRRFSIEEICRFFNTPPQLIGDTAKQTFANYSEAVLHYHATGLLPWIVRFEQEANRKLFRRVPGRRQPFLKLNASAIVRADIEKRTKAYALGRQWGWLSVNDVRRLEDMEPLGPEGDVYLQPMNMEPAGAEPPDDGTREQAATLRRVK
jgi:HK97 family phage portal protein